MKTAYGLPKKREAVVDALQAAFADGNLEELEYESRLSKTYEAKTLDELKEILYDFPTPTIYKIFPVNRKYPTTQRTQELYTGEFEEETTLKTHKVIMNEQMIPLRHIVHSTERFSNFMGSLNISASNAQVQTDLCKMRIDSWFGNTKVDLLNPELAGREVHLHIHGGLSEVKIIVPPGTQVSRNVQLILGEFSHKRKNAFLRIFTKEKKVEDHEMAFHLVIHGSFVLGSISVVY